MRFTPLPPELAAERAALQGAARRYGVHPSKQHSQHFLLDQRVVTTAVTSAGLRPEERVLEVGAGFGILTDALLASGAQVLAFEIDERLVAALSDRFRDAKGLQIIAGDFFRWFREHAAELGASPYAILSNLPYHASSYFFETVLSSPHPPTTIVVLLQAEVADRIAAAPGGFSMLSLAVQVYGTPSILLRVSRNAFWPQPEVDSALLMVRAIKKPEDDATPLFRLAKMAFANRRKQLHNSLKAGLHGSDEEMQRLFSLSGLSPTLRPQDLSVDAWWLLTRSAATVFGMNKS